VEKIVIVTNDDDDDDDVDDGDDDENDISNINVVKIDTVYARRRKCLLFYTHCKHEQIPHVWHRLNEVQRNTLLE
jgi:hypothetical protein